jgi:hypothetical protein
MPEDLWIPYRFQLVREKEPIDPEWSTSTEHLLLERFVDTSNRHLVAVQCRRMTCLTAFILRPPAEPPNWPILDWAGARWGTTRERSDGWIDVLIVNKRHPDDRPDVGERVASHGAPNSSAACRAGRRGYSTESDFRTCAVVASFGHAQDFLCFGSRDDACDCACSMWGRELTRCRMDEAHLVGCSGPHRYPEWKVEFFPP